MRQDESKYFKKIKLEKNIIRFLRRQKFKIMACGTLQKIEKYFHMIPFYIYNIYL
jgi:hypothetical protein